MIVIIFDKKNLFYSITQLNRFFCEGFTELVKNDSVNYKNLIENYRIDEINIIIINVFMNNNLVNFIIFNQIRSRKFNFLGM